jgi:hypothetical protein
MDIATELLLMWMVLVAVVITLYVVDHKGQKRAHRLVLRNLRERASTHQKQIYKRNRYLGRYDFLEYNLDASLVPQYEIKL